MIARLALVVALAAWFGRASAQPAGAQAEVLFREGRSLMAAGKVAEACTAFEQSQKLDPAITTLLNLASCREKNGQFATAWGLFLEAERQTRSATDKSTQQLHDVAQGRAKKLEPRVSKLAINIPDKNQVDGLEILRDKDRVERAMWNRALPIDGGTYTISAHAPGASPWATQITVGGEADNKTVEIPDLRSLPHDPPPTALAPPVAAAAPPVAAASPPVAAASPPVSVASAPEAAVHDSPEPSPNRGSKLVPLVVGGGALALVGGAVGMSLWGDSTYDKAKAETTDQGRRDELYDSANTKRYIAEGLAVAGIASAGVAVWLYLQHRDEGRPVTAHRRQIIVSPTGIAVMGAF